MANVTIRNLDDGVVERLKAQAKTQHRSLEAELRHVLTQAADQHERMAAFRRDAARIRAMTPKDRPQTDSTLLIREDRDR
jgi:plasmid stability protein